MDRILIGLAIVLAIAGYSAAADLKRDCDDPVVCIGEKPDEYKLYQEDMDKLITQNKRLTEAQKEKLDNYNDGIELSGDDENCWSETTVKQPFVIQTNVSSNIVVQSMYFEQKIKWTECHQNKPEKQHCFTSVFTPGVGEIEARCGEKYGAVSLYIYDPKHNELRYMMFEVPVACSCRFKQRN